jgi:hypothetical protein
MEIAGIQERDKVLEREKVSCTVDDQIFSAALLHSKSNITVYSSYKDIRVQI